MQAIWLLVPRTSHKRFLTVIHPLFSGRRQRKRYIYRPPLMWILRKRLIATLLLLHCCYVLMAQDPHFSQFFASPLTLNPAFTGKFHGTYRIALNNRDQWPTINQAFRTSTLAADFKPLGEDRNNIWGVGVMGLADQSSAGALKFNYVSLSTAYHITLDDNGYHQLGLGFQGTFANMVLNTALLSFEDQLTIDGFTGVSGETFNNATLKSRYFDLNSGVLYTGSTNGSNFYYAGVSMYHVNRPKQSFTGTATELKPRTTIQAGGFFPFSDHASLHLSALQSFQAGVRETVLGGAVQLIANPLEDKPTSIYIGAWTRMKDALIPYLGVEFGDLRLGASYDVNTSALRTASSGAGGIEVSLIYTRRPSTDRPVLCPKF